MNRYARQSAAWIPVYLARHEYRNAWHYFKRTIKYLMKG